MAKQKGANRRKIPTLYRTAESVEWAIQNPVEHFLGSIRPDSNTRSIIVDREISRLEILLGQLRAEEDKFFSRLRVTGNTPKEKYENLVAKLTDWNNSGAISLISGEGKFWTLVKEILMLDPGYLTNVINNSDRFRTEVIDAVVSDTEEEVWSKVFKIFNDKFKTDEIKGDSSIKTTRFNRSRSGAKTGLKRILEIKRLSNGKFTVSLGGGATKTEQRKIATLLQLEIKKNSKEPMPLDEATQNSVLQLLSSQIADVKVCNALKEEIKKNWRKYALAANESVISGFLGEVYWNAFFSYMGLNSTPLGDNKEEFITRYGKTSPPVDILLEGMGAQVKNYSIKNIIDVNEVQSTGAGGARNEMTITGFLDRLDLSKEADKLRKFYFSWRYNRPTDKATDVYLEIFDRFEDIMNQSQVEVGLKQRATDRIDKLIKIDSEFERQGLGLSEHLIKNKKNVINTLYIINNRPYFSSDMVQSIIETLRNSEVNNTIILDNFSFASNTPTPFGPDSRYPYRNTYEATNEGVSGKVRYSIIFNINDLLRRVDSHFS